MRAIPWVHDLDPMLAPLLLTPTPAGDAVGGHRRERPGRVDAPGNCGLWQFASSANGGRLLSNTGGPMRPAG